LYIPHFQAPVWGYSLLNLGAFTVIARAAHLRLLQGRAFQRLGKVSYGFYIFHLPVIWLAAMLTGDRSRLLRRVQPDGGRAWRSSPPGLLAELSYRFLESPLLRLKVNFGGAPKPEGERGAGCVNRADSCAVQAGRLNLAPAAGRGSGGIVEVEYDRNKVSQSFKEAADLAGSFYRANIQNGHKDTGAALKHDELLARLTIYGTCTTATSCRLASCCSRSFAGC
jgi:hypothetical protein